MDISIPKVNVNIGLYIISLIAIGFGEKYSLRTLYWFGIASGVPALLSIFWVLPSYVRRYLTKGKAEKKKADISN